MDVNSNVDMAASGIAAAIGEAARARILYCLMDGRARTSTELAVIAEVNPSTASVHLSRLQTAQLINVVAQGKHRYFSLAGPDVAHVLEALSVMAGATRSKFVPRTANPLCTARTCYDHMAGAVGVSLHDCFHALGWLSNGYDVTPLGAKEFEALNIDLAAMRKLRRRFACACLDWSERRPHLGGALGSAILKLALERKWVTQDLNNRALGVTSGGRREILRRFGLHV